MKKGISFHFCFLFALAHLAAQNLAGTYSVAGQDGQIVLRMQYTAGSQLQGTLTDMHGNVYQVQAAEEDGEAFGTLTSQQGGLYFQAMRQGGDLYLTLLPADSDGQPDFSGARQFVMSAGSTGVQPGSGGAGQAPGGPLAGPAGGQATSGNSAWNGTFSGNITGTPTAMNLQVDGNQLSGAIDAGGYRYTLNGTAQGNQAQGKLLDPQTQGSMDYSATLNSNQVKMTVRNPANGQSMELAFTRGPASQTPGRGGQAPGSAQQQSERDARLVGGWNYTDTYVSGDFSMAAQWKLIVNADGSYIYGDGRVVGGNSSVSADSGTGGDVTRGQWRTENGIIYVDTGAGWEAYCRYTTDGQSLLMQFGNGRKQLWNRMY